MQYIINGLKWLFTKTLPAGSVMGIPLRVHLLLLIFMPFFALAMMRGFANPVGWPLAIAGGLMYVGILYGSVLLHELGHAWGCRLVGGQTDQILLTPIGGLHMGTGGMESPRSELIVVALGPAVSVALLLAGWGATALAEAWLNWISGPWWHTLLWMLARFTFGINLILAAFNLLCPMFPLDCGRLLRAGFSLKYNPQLVTRRVCQVGIGLGIFFIMCIFFRIDLGVIGDASIWLGIIGILSIQVCLMQMEGLKYGQVYMKGDVWGERQVFYDDDLVRQAKATAVSDIRGLTRLRRGKVIRKSAKVTGPAQVIDISPPADPDTITDKAELRVVMKRAADTENFRLAAACKRRLRELEKQENA